MSQVKHFRLCFEATEWNELFSGFGMFIQSFYRVVLHWRRV